MCILLLINYSEQSSWNYLICPFASIESSPTQRGVLSVLPQSLMGNLHQLTGWMWTDTGQSDKSKSLYLI